MTQKNYLIQKNKFITFLFLMFIAAMSYGDGLIAKEKRQLLQGDPIITDSKFVKAIDRTCVIDVFSDKAEEQSKSCALPQMKFNYYSFFDKLSNKSDTLYKNNIVEFYLKATKNSPEYAHSEFEVTLFTKKNNKIVDRLPLYKQDCFGEALVCTTQYHYIDNNLNIWLLQVVEDEEGNRVKSYKQYKINKTTAKVELKNKVGF